MYGYVGTIISCGLSSTPYLMSGVSIVTVHIGNQQQVYGDVYLEKKIDLTVSDHMIIGLYSILILFSIKFAVGVTWFGWVLVWLNIFFFDVYAYYRKNAN